MQKYESTIRVRMSQADAHYGGDMVDGAKILKLFGDIATELLIRHDGDEGLFLRYDEVKFLSPVYAGDFIEAKGWITEVGKTSRKIEFVAKKVIQSLKDPTQPTAADYLDDPIIITEARGVCVAPEKLQRKRSK
ncbi:MAG: hotdog fold thioesterase [Syntrophales bacterium]|nr:hotdog fold thioesterase [Syntrophales bacterium]MCK9528689.1 hotdog fold thioesterase [Syntrophales bacterium]MDX9922642.1 hotdog fold domain-containing protein [Syntrophales bacterium]